MKKNVLKKAIILLLLFILLSTTGAVCGQKGTKKGEEIELTVWRVFDDESVFKKALESYQGKYPNIKINYIEKEYAEYEEETVNALAAGTGPDIWSIRNDWVYKQYDKLDPMPNNLLQKENDTRSNLEIYKTMFPDVVVEENVIDDKIYGLPLSVDTLVVYYNKAHFNTVQNQLFSAKRKEEGKMFNFSPNNWEEFLTMSKLLTLKDGNNITKSGAAFGTSSVNNSEDILTVLMMQNNTQMTSADKLTATFNLPIVKETGEPIYAGTQALNFYTSFSNPDKENYMWNDSMGDSVQAFLQERASMIIDYGYQQQRIAQEAPKLNYGIGPLPQIAGSTVSTDYASYWTETVTNNCEHPKEAWEFIKYLYSNYLDKYDSITKRPSPKRINSLQIPETKERAFTSENPLRYQIMTAKPYYKGKYPMKVDNTFYKMIEDVVVNKEPLQKSIDAAAATVTNLYQMSK